jgi:hypothetical protein
MQRCRQPFHRGSGELQCGDPVRARGIHDRRRRRHGVSSDGVNTLIITRVQLVVREIELKRVEATTSCDEGSDDRCEKLEVGPVLLDLPLGTGGAARSFSVAVDTGTFDEVEFEIHKPSDDDATDASFVQSHPEFAGASIRVTGSYNGVAFEYTSDLNAEEEIELSPPLAVAASGDAELTLLVDLDRWFRDPAGALVDPASASIDGTNEQLVEANIRNTLHAFEDEDHDGTDDHGGEDDGPTHD